MWISQSINQSINQPPTCTGPHALRPCVLLCRVYNDTNQVLPLGDQPQIIRYPLTKVKWISWKCLYCSKNKKCCHFTLKTITTLFILRGVPYASRNDPKIVNVPYTKWTQSDAKFYLPLVFVVHTFSLPSVFVSNVWCPNYYFKTSLFNKAEDFGCKFWTRTAALRLLKCCDALAREERLFTVNNEWSIA
jgi:hypothetical protein